MIERLYVRNHRGARVPAVLGLVLAVFGTISVVLVATLSGPGVGTAGWTAAAAALLVCLAGLADDLAPEGPRGLRAHLAALARGHVTTGMVKLLVITGAAAVAVAAVPARTGSARLAGVVVVASTANLWNGLDVRPARALKFSYLAAVFVLPVEAVLLPFAPGVVLGSVLVLPWDAGERAMLGDAGSNLLGFTIGIALVHDLHGFALWGAAAAGVALNVLADTVTLSRLIDLVPPLRWYDRLGRSTRDE